MVFASARDYFASVRGIFAFFLFFFYVEVMFCEQVISFVESAPYFCESVRFFSERFQALQRFLIIKNYFARVRELFAGEMRQFYFASEIFFSERVRIIFCGRVRVF